MSPCALDTQSHRTQLFFSLFSGYILESVKCVKGTGVSAYGFLNTQEGYSGVAIVAVFNNTELAGTG